MSRTDVSSDTMPLKCSMEDPLTTDMKEASLSISCFKNWHRMSLIQYCSLALAIVLGSSIFDWATLTRDTHGIGLWSQVRKSFCRTLFSPWMLSNRKDLQYGFERERLTKNVWKDLNCKARTKKLEKIYAMWTRTWSWMTYSILSGWELAAKLRNEIPLYGISVLVLPYWM